jgi:anti-sigma B factor antagonist
VNDARHIDVGLARLAIEDGEDLVVATLAGELDISNVPAVRDAIVESMRDGARLLVLDFTDVRYIDSSSVAMVLGFASELTVKRGRLALVAPDGGQVRRVLHFSGIAESLDVHDDRASALGQSESHR